MRRLREITPEEIKEALQCPDSFGYNGDLDLFNTWSLGPQVDMRGSDLRMQSNSEAMQAELQRLEKAGEIEPESWKLISCRHWGFGWVEHLAFKAIDDDGEPTKVFSHVMEMVDCIQEHVVLDSDDYSRREYEAQLESIENNAPNLKDDVHEDWVRKVFSWLWDEDQTAFSGDNRTFIAPEYVAEACEALGFAEEEDDE